MNMFKYLITLISGFLITSCTYSKEQSEDSYSTATVLTKNNVSNCFIEEINVDFCSEDKLRKYNIHIKDQPNFFHNKIILVDDGKRDIGKGERRHIKNIILLDPKTNKVIPLPQSLGNFVDERLQVIFDEKPQIRFSKNDNKICLSGTTFAKSDNNINVENDCYIFEKNNFKKMEVEKNENKKSYKTSIIYNSDLHFKCINDIKVKECENLNLFSTSILFKKYDFININDGPSAILEKDNFKIIISPFEDESGPNLRIMKVNNNQMVEEKYIYANKKVLIDSDFKVEYSEGLGKKTYNFK